MKNNDKDNSWEKSFFIKSMIAGISFLTVLVGLVSATFNLISGQGLKVAIAILVIIFSSVIGIIAFSLRTVQRNSGIKSKRNYQSFTVSISKITHTMLHKLRNSIYYMEHAFNNRTSDSAETFERTITQDILTFVQSLAEELSQMTEYKIRACIKCIDYTTANEESIDNMKLITFARSGQNNIVEMMSEHRMPISVSQNTDFMEIIESGNNERQRQYFYEKNLEEYDRKLRSEGKMYKNTNQRWKDDYITTIVCPIRLKRQFSSIEGASLKYDIVGFLCVDSLDEKAFDNEYSDFCIELLKGLADILYVYLDQFIDYYTRLC